MTNNESIKNPIMNAFEPHLYELDPTKLSNLDLFGKKKFTREYQIIQRKIIFSTKFDISSASNKNNKSSKSISDSKAETEKKYLSNYKFFRDFLCSNFESNEIKTELSDIKNLLDNSKKIREDIEKFFNQNSKEDSDFFIDKGKKDENNLNNNNNINLNTSPNTPSHNNVNAHKLNKTMISEINNNNTSQHIKDNENKFNEIMQNFKLLKIKDNTDENKKEDFFRFYSELDNPVDTNVLLANDNIAKNKFLSFHRKLSKFYHTEQFFTEFASEYNKPPKGKNAIAPDIRMRMPVDYIDCIFKPRGHDTFATLDAFMLKYDREHKASLREKDLLENIYGILSKCDNSNFLSFLYSKNEDFKYIYDNFAKNNGNKVLEALELSGISNESEIKGESSYFNIKENNQNFTVTNRPRRNSFKAFNHLDDLFGHFYFDKIVFIPETLDEKLFKFLINHKENAFGVLNNDLVKTLNSYAKALFNKENLNLLLFTKNKIMKILSLKNEELDPNVLKFHDLEEPLAKLQIHRINKNIIGEKINANLSTKEIEIFNNSMFYILEIKNNKMSGNVNKELIGGSNKDILNLNSIVNSGNSPNANANNITSSFYLIKITNENIERFEIACDSLKLYIPNADRENKAFRKKNTIDSVIKHKNTNQQESQVGNKAKEIFSEEENLTPEISDNEIVNNNYNKNLSSNNTTNKKKDEKRPSVNVDDNLVNRGDDYMLKRAVNKKLANFIKSSNNDVKPSTSISPLKKINELNFEKKLEGVKLLNTIHEKSEENEEVNNINNDSEHTFIMDNNDQIKFTDKYLLKMNGKQFNFYIKTDKSTPRIEYSENVSSFNEKKVLEFSKILNFIAQESKNSNKFSGIIKLNLKNNPNEGLEIMTYNEAQHNDFINKISKYIPRK